MVRDMELMRKILFAIERDYQPGAGMLWGVKVDGYDMPTIAEHCDLLHQQGLVKSYKASFADNTIQSFHVGNITASGYEYLEIVRNDDTWQKITTRIEQDRRPKTIEEIVRLAGVFTGHVIKEMTG